jgi:hypothetical protein
MYSRICFITMLLIHLTGMNFRAQAQFKDKPKEVSKIERAYIIQLSTNPAPTLPSNYNSLSSYNFYGITWNGKTDDNLKFAKQMGYSYVMYQPGMEHNLLGRDFHFLLESPEQFALNNLGIERFVHLDKTYSPEQISLYSNYCVLKDTASSFPDNLATGWWERNSFSVEPDWQQKKVRDCFTNTVMEYVQQIERKDKNFLFGGFAWDVPNLTGDFWKKGNSPSATLEQWTGKNSSLPGKGTTHDYATYGEGKAAFYISLREAQKHKYPDRLLSTIYEPFGPYGYLKEVEKLDFVLQKKLLQDVLFTQECGTGNYQGITGTEFVDDPRLFASGLLSKDRTGSSTPDNHTLVTNLNIAQKAAINGAWFNWYGRFSGTGDKIPLNNIYEVPNWLQLIRVVANWDNLNGIPLANRTLNLNSYTSPNSRMDSTIIYSRQPKTQKLFVVFLNASAEIKLNPGEKIVSVKHVDAYFCETDEGKDDLIVKGNKIKLKR